MQGDGAVQWRGRHPGHSGSTGIDNDVLAADDALRLATDTKSIIDGRSGAFGAVVQAQSDSCHVAWPARGAVPVGLV